VQQIFKNAISSKVSKRERLYHVDFGLDYIFENQMQLFSNIYSRLSLNGYLYLFPL